MKEHRLYISGQWLEGESAREILSPFDGRPAARVHFAGRGQILEAIEAAGSAFEETRRLPSHKRASILESVAREIENRAEELSVSIALVAGKPIRSARVEAARAVNTFRLSAEEAKRVNGEIVPLDLAPNTEERWGLVRRFPLGPIVGITPFNFPLNLVAHKVGPALAAGNSFILRPASQVSPTALLLAEILDSTDLPPGSFNVVPCGYEAADALIEDPAVKMVTFTGSPEIGWGLKKRAHKKRVTLELGGNAAVIVEPDADLDFAVSRCLLGSFSYSGQICISIQRIFLHQDIYDRFMASFTAAAEDLKLGDPMDEETDVGPMINAAAADQTEAWVSEALEQGAGLVCGGKRTGSIYHPTILEKVKPELRISCREAFAPVAVVSAYSRFETALENVNDSIYGLQAGVFTHDLDKAFLAYHSLDVGGVIVNDIPTFRIDHMPYGGVKESGFGREGVRYAVEEMTDLKLMALNLKGRPSYRSAGLTPRDRHPRQEKSRPKSRVLK